MANTQQFGAHRMRKVTTPKERKKALVKAVLEASLIQGLIDLGKGSSGYREFLNRCLPTWVKNRGAYPSFKDAMADAPKDMRIGYDHDEIADIHKWQTDIVFPGDYPVMFWLGEALRDSKTVFDLGGSVGVVFYAWQRYVDFAKDLSWTVCEVPPVVREGAKLAQENGENRLHFTSRFEDADGSDILLMSGCLQCIETPVLELLKKLNHLPKHLIVNRTPLNPANQCVTLMNISLMVTPYYVFRADRFIADIESCGYKLIDAWSDTTHQCWIPFYPENSVDRYSGLYFQRI